MTASLTHPLSASWWWLAAAAGASTLVFAGVSGPLPARRWLVAASSGWTLWLSVGAAGIRMDAWAQATLLFAVVSMILCRTSLKAGAPHDETLAIGSVLSGGAAYLCAVHALSMSASLTWTLPVAAGGILMLLWALADRLGLNSRAAGAVWALGGTTSAGIGVVFTLSVWMTNGTLSPWWTASLQSFGILAAAFAAGLAARRIQIWPLRHFVFPLVLLAALTQLEGTPISYPAASLVAAGVGGALFVATLLAWRRAPESGWLSPLRLGAALFSVASAFPLIWATDWQRPLAAVIASLGLQVAVAGVATRRVALTALAPAIELVAWLTWCDAVSWTNPQVIWVAAGLTALLTVETLRAGGVGHGPGSTRPVRAAVVCLETAGVAAVMWPAVSASFQSTPAYAVELLGLGGLAGGWALLTRMKRRIGWSVSALLLGVLALIGPPLVAALPPWGPLTMWVTFAVVGMLLLGLGAMAERAKTTARSAHTWAHELLVDWN